VGGKTIHFKNNLPIKQWMISKMGEIGKGGTHPTTPPPPYAESR